MSATKGSINLNCCNAVRLAKYASLTSNVCGELEGACCGQCSLSNWMPDIQQTLQLKLKRKGKEKPLKKKQIYYILEALKFHMIFFFKRDLSHSLC